MPAGRGIAARIGRVVEIPQTHQARFLTRELARHAFADLFLRPGQVPNPHFIYLAFEVEVIGESQPGGRTAEIVSRGARDSRGPNAPRTTVSPLDS